MKKLLLGLLTCTSLLYGCSKSEEAQQLTTGNEGLTIAYEFTNQINNEAITIIEHDKNNEVKNVCTVNYGETSKKIEAPKQSGNIYVITFRTSAKSYPNSTYFETVEVYTAGKNTFTFILKKSDSGKYVAETGNE